MDNKSLHIQYIKEKGEKEIFFTELFNEEEIRFLRKYYYWGEGLVNGHIKPITEEQNEFVIIYDSYLKNSRKPPISNEKWFSRLELMQQAWVKYYYVLLLGNRVLNYTTNQNALNIFNFPQPRADINSGIPGMNSSSSGKHEVVQTIRSKNRKCISCGDMVEDINEYKCTKCFVPITKKKKPSRGTITSNRLTFKGTKWNDDSYER